ncbi:MAG: hypothetical protein JWO98_3298 [Frankiales bacterium]|nr:hypothetical protein [Frankiales bacterium]
MTALSATATTVDVTPPAGTPLAGYGARGDAVSTGCHDPLEAALFWLHDEGSGRDVVWVTLDVVGVDAELARAVSAAVAGAIGRPDAAVLLCASHTHSSAAYWFHRPAAQPAMGPEDDAASAAMRADLVARIAGAARDLPGRLQAVRLLAAEGPVGGVGANRHRADGPHDPTVGLLAAVAEDGGVVAALVNYASHPTVLGHGNLLWSADWPGATRRALAGALAGLRPFGGAQAAGAGHPAVLFLQGAAGDVSARFVRRGQNFEEADRLGGLLAGQALAALLDHAEDVDGEIVVARTTAVLPTRGGGSPADARAAEAGARAEWVAVRREHTDGGPEERLARTRHEGALAALRMAETGLPPSVELPLSVVAVGRHAWVHVPVELFASFGLRLRKGSPFPATRVVGYTDGYLGYVPDAAAYRDGVYESGVSLFGPDGGEQLCAAVFELLEQVAPGKERAR